MNIQGLQKLTLLDYPGKLACTIFTAPCNLRCPFCHNSGLITGWDDSIDWAEIRGFLKSRVGILEGVCITGGEPTLHPDLVDHLTGIKSLGFLVKLDTNGTNPQVLVGLVDAGLVDYVALDVKNSPQRYNRTVGVKDFDVTSIATSIEFLLSHKVDYEFRTTVVREYHEEQGLLELAQWIKGAKRYYLQTFVDSEQVLQKGLHAYSPEEMRALAELIRPIIPVVEVRGI